VHEKSAEIVYFATSNCYASMTCLQAFLQSQETPQVGWRCHVSDDCAIVEIDVRAYSLLPRSSEHERDDQ
jgi:hypothetical protein